MPCCLDQNACVNLGNTNDTQLLDILESKRVKDIQKGFKDNIIDHVFEPYETTKPGGSGLGLSIVKHVLAHHRSQLEIERLTLKILTWCLPKLFEQQADVTPAVVKTMNIQRQDQQLYLLFYSLVMQSLSLSEMAIKLGLSVSTLQRKIKDRYAMTAVEYVRQKKLEKAKSSLVLDNLSIGEIAYIAGYAHVSNFVTAFKKKFELTPAQFRTIHTSYRVR